MGYVNSSNWTESQTQSDATYKGENQEAGALAATLHPVEAHDAYTEGHSDMPELLTSDGEDDWDPHVAGLATC